jgi:hypothetical protein
MNHVEHFDRVDPDYLYRSGCCFPRAGGLYSRCRPQHQSRCRGKDQTVTAPVAPVAVTEDIVPGPSAPNTGDQNIGTVDVKITKSKMAPVKWNGEEQLALGPAGLQHHPC